jgi:Periplasmic binding protein
LADPRIVSLVPSLTELVFALGLGQFVVGRTGFCVHPSPGVQHIPKLGGTKQIDEAALLALKPTHLIVNKDENQRSVFDRLAPHIEHTIVTHPVRAEDNLDLFAQFADVFKNFEGVSAAAKQLSKDFSQALSANLNARTNMAREQVLYLIWKNPWMSVAPNTYISSMLDTVAWESLRIKPHEALASVGSARYPTLSDDEVFDAPVTKVLLSSEPYKFQNKHIAELQPRLTRKGALAALIDGEMCSWYGPRAIQGLHYLRQLRQALA